jgi:hypothetical protein
VVVYSIFRKFGNIFKAGYGSMTARRENFAFTENGNDIILSTKVRDGSYALLPRRRCPEEELT